MAGKAIEAARFIPDYLGDRPDPDAISLEEQRAQKKAFKRKLDAAKREAGHGIRSPNVTTKNRQ